MSSRRRRQPRPIYSSYDDYDDYDDHEGGGPLVLLFAGFMLFVASILMVAFNNDVENACPDPTSGAIAPAESTVIKTL